jgi:hypothetical protein
LSETWRQNGRDVYVFANLSAEQIDDADHLLVQVQNLRFEVAAPCGAEQVAFPWAVSDGIN